MALSAFDEKSHQPTEAEVHQALGKAQAAWSGLIAAVEEQGKPLSQVWRFTSVSTGWGMRLKHQDRVILYMTPQEGKFLVSLALGEKAVSAARQAKLPKKVLDAIEAAPRYAEGRGVRIMATGVRQIAALAKLASLKLAS